MLQSKLVRGVTVTLFMPGNVSEEDAQRDRKSNTIARTLSAAVLPLGNPIRAAGAAG